MDGFDLPDRSTVGIFTKCNGVFNTSEKRSVERTDPMLLFIIIALCFLLFIVHVGLEIEL